MKIKNSFFFIGFLLFFSCKKNVNNNLNTGSNGLNATSTINLLTSKVWWQFNKGINYPANNIYFQLQFSVDNKYGPNGGTVVFGPENEVGSTAFGDNSSTDAFNLYVSDGITYLNITDVVSAVSLTGFNTYYKILSINTSGFTITSAGQPTPVAPSFPADTITYEQAN